MANNDNRYTWRIDEMVIQQFLFLSQSSEPTCKSHATETYPQIIIIGNLNNLSLIQNYWDYKIMFTYTRAVHIHTANKKCSSHTQWECHAVPPAQLPNILIMCTYISLLQSPELNWTHSIANILLIKWWLNGIYCRKRIIKGCHLYSKQIYPGYHTQNEMHLNDQYTCHYQVSAHKHFKIKPNAIEELIISP